MADSFSFVKEALQFTNDSVGVINSSFGPNGLDCMVSTTSGALMLTNDGVQVLKSLSYKCPIGRLIFGAMELFYQKTGDFSKKFFLLLREMLCNVVDIVPSEAETQQQQLLAIPQGMDVVLGKILPELLNELKILDVIFEVTGDAKCIEKSVLSIIKTNMNGKFSPKSCKDLTNLLKSLLFESEMSNDMLDLKSRTITLLDTFSDSFWEVPGLPLSSSIILPGIVIPQAFLTTLRNLPHKSATKSFKFLLVGTSLGYDLPQCKTTLALKDLQHMKDMLEWRTKFIKSLIEQFVNQGVELIISSTTLPETVIHFCNQFHLAAIQLVRQEDITRICNIFNISAMLELELEQDLIHFIGEAVCSKPIQVGLHTYVYLEAANEIVKQVLLYAPNEAMCRQYSIALQNALKILKTSFTTLQDGTHSLSMVSGGGTFELGLSFALERYRSKNELENKVESACCILEKALLSIPRQLVNNSGKRLPVCSITAQAKQALCSGTKLLGLRKNGTLQDLNEKGVLEPAIGNYLMVSSVVQLFSQIIRTDKIIHVKKLPINNLSDSDDSDDDVDL